MFIHWLSGVLMLYISSDRQQDLHQWYYVIFIFLEVFFFFLAFFSSRIYTYRIINMIESYVTVYVCILMSTKLFNKVSHFIHS